MERLWIYIILGIIQGITEPIPISSSGHLVLAKSLFNLDTSDPTLEILLHLGSLVAILVFYWTDVKNLIVLGLGYIFKPSEVKFEYFKYGLYLVVATIPAGLVGLLFRNNISAIMISPKAVGITLIYTACILWFASKAKVRQTNEKFTFKHALLVGIFQAIALLPGVSRSGSTTGSAMILGFDSQFSMRFSFLLFIPIAVLVMIMGLPDILANPVFLANSFAYIVATIVSGLVTFAALHIFKIVLRKKKLHYFALYCLIIGIFTLIFI